jgi:hypothetical protein
MPTWYYFSRPTHLAFHDFTLHKTPPKNLKSLLGLGLKFIPTPNNTNSWSKIASSGLERLKRSLHLRFHFASHTTTNTKDDTEYDPKLYVPSSWSPPHWTYPKLLLDERLGMFSDCLSRKFRRRYGRTNLLPHQHRALSHLQQQKDFLIAPCDKNLGPAIIETEDYLRIAFRDHLNDTATYQPLSGTDSDSMREHINRSLLDWIKTHRKSLTAMERKFLRYHHKNNEHPFARFYLTLKAHKLKPGENVTKLKSRPIVSCPGSLLAPLGTWVDRKLQPVATIQQSYFRNSFDLRQELLQLQLPANARLFTADAVSMYTNIPTNTAINIIGQKLRRYASSNDSSYPVNAVQSALSLIMRNNVFTFGDMTFKQLNGTAMGTPPAPPYATLYYSVYEDSFLHAFNDSVLFYKRFIDDVIGIWLCDPDSVTNEDQWCAFQAAMNQGRGLSWEFSNLSHKVDFMDLTISISENRIQTTLYEKPMNLYLYIPPHSAHPPGLLPGMIHGTLFRIFTLCSDDSDRKLRTQTFLRRLLARGYKIDDLRPLFHRAIERAKAYTGPGTAPTIAKDGHSVILHLPFHPNDPTSREIQQTWRQCVAEPQYKMPLWDMRNPKTRGKCNIRRMIIAYHRPMNLGNILSHRKLDDLPGPPVSSFYHPD